MIIIIIIMIIIIMIIIIINNQQLYFPLSLTGKIEMTIELVDGEEVARQPVGRGREDPNVNPKLDPPNRPSTSFFWLTSPLKVFRYIIWRRHKCCIICTCLVLVIAAMIVSFVYNLPANLMQTLLNVGKIG